MTASDRRDDVAGAKSAQRQERHERILQAARDELFERGFDADVYDVVKRAGVGAGTVYRHFPNKEALFRQIAEEMVLATREGFRRIVTEESDARRCVARTMELGFGNVREYGQLAIQLFHGSNPPQYEGLFERDAMHAFFASLIQLGIDQGHFRPDLDVPHSVGMWFALVAPSMLGRFLEQRSVEEVAAATSRFFLAGLSGSERR
jgi:AcrR family transcriptional regulator